MSGASALKDYLTNERIDQVAFSFLKHLAHYATGRTLNYNEIEQLREQGLELGPQDYRMKDMVHFLVRSAIFMEK